MPSPRLHGRIYAVLWNNYLIMQPTSTTYISMLERLIIKKFPSNLHIIANGGF